MFADMWETLYHVLTVVWGTVVEPTPEPKTNNIVWGV